MMFKRSRISPQYLRSNRIFISVVEMKSPAHFIIKECFNREPSPEVVRYTEADEMMQKYYKSVEYEFFQLPLKDAIVVVRVDEIFCRAQVRSILSTTEEYLFKVFLLDYGKECNVSRSCVFEINSDFLKHPFQAVSFKLVDVEPVSLVMDSRDLSLSYGPVETWDSSCISYMEGLIKALDYAYIIVKGVEGDCLIGSLYMTLCDAKVICINEELIVKKFARHKQSAMENVNTLESFTRKISMKSLSDAEHCLGSLSSSVRSHCSLSSTNNAESNDSRINLTKLQKLLNKNHSSENINSNQNIGIVSKPANKLRRKMTGCIAVDESEIINKEIKTYTDKAASIKDPVMHETLMKSHQIMSPLKSSEPNMDLQQLKMCAEVNKTSTEMAPKVSNLKSLESAPKEVLSAKKLKAFLSSAKSARSSPNNNNNNTNDILQDSPIKSPKSVHEVSPNMQLSTLSPIKSRKNSTSKEASPNKNLSTSLTAEVFNKSVKKENTLFNKNGQEIVSESFSHSIESSPSQKCQSCPIKEDNSFEKNTDLQTKNHFQNTMSSLSHLLQASPKEANKEEFAVECQTKTVGSSSPCISVSTQKKVSNEKEAILQCTPKKNSVKLDVLKNFLHHYKKLPVSVTKSEDTSLPLKSTKEKLDFSVSRETLIKVDDSEKVLLKNDADQSKSNEEIESLIKEIISDADDSDDLLQNVLDPEKKKISSSGTESDSPNKSNSKFNQQEENISFDFSGKNLWEKQKIPALPIGEAVPIPVLGVNETTFVPSVKKILQDVHFWGPSCIQSIVWPAMNRLRNLAAIAPPHSGKTIAYLLPLVSNLIGGVFYNDVPKGKGPIALILCSSWKKVQAVYDYFHIFGGSCKIKILTFFADGRSKKNKISAMANGCDIVISVPSCLSELFEEKAVDVSRCCHLILDDGSTLLSHQMSEIRNIMLNFIENIKSRSPLTIPLQILICAERWTRSVSSFVDKFMSSPLLLFTSFLESAIYAQIPIYGHVCLKKKKNKLLELLQNIQRTVVCTSSKENAMDIHSYLTYEGVRSYVVTEEMEHYIFDGILQDWKSVHSSTVPYCLIITDAVLIDMPVRDANCLIHYDVPEISRLQFGNRFSCISEHFTKTDQADKCAAHILISEECLSQSKSLVKIINRSNGAVSKELKNFVNSVPEVLRNVEIPLCNYMKAYGACEFPQCEFRHHINSSIDKPAIIPKEGDVHCLVTHVFDATHFYVRILKYITPSEEKSHKFVSMSAVYAKIGFQLKKIYTQKENKEKVDVPVVGKSYIYEEENNLFFRVKVLNITEDSAYPSSKQFILAFQDEGWVKSYKNCQLFYLLSDIELPPPVAAEVYLCGVSPLDTCLDWNYRATHFMHSLVSGKEIHGKIVLCLGDTLWLYPLILREKLMFVNDYVNLMTLDKALKENGYAAENNKHLQLLHKACEGKITFPKIAESPAPDINESNEQVRVSYAFLDLNVNEEVYVSSVISPHQFYVQRAKFTECLDSLLDEINDHIENKILKKCQIPQKGLHCIAPFTEDNRYYRAVIMDFNCESDEVYLFYVDYGDTARCKSDSIYIIPQQFLLLPFQAIECELDGIAPAHGGWSDKAVDSLHNLTRDCAGDMKILQLQAFSKSVCYDGGNHYVVDLWDFEKSLSDQLLEAGLVVISDKADISEVPLSNQGKEIWDDIPAGYAISSDDENLSTDEKNSRAAFLIAVAKMIVQGERPSTEEIDEISKCVKENNENRLNFEAVVSDEKKVETVKQNFPFPKHRSPFQSLQKLLKCTKSQIKSVKPNIKWWDSKEKLYILILIKNLKIYEFDLQESGFKFKTSINNFEYISEETFFSKVSLEDRIINVTPEGLHVILSKEEPLKWSRLIKGNLKSPYIKYDVNHIEDSDSEDIPDGTHILNEEENMGKIEGAPYLSDEDEDKDFSDDEETYVQPWKELAIYKDPFNPLT